MLNKAYYSKTLLVAISFGAIASITSGAALAGFEWVPKAHQSSVKPNEKMHVQEAPAPSVSNEQLSVTYPATPETNPEHTSEIIHVSPHSVQSESATALQAPDIMTPSPFDIIAEPAAQPVINTIDFTNSNAAQIEEEDRNNETVEHIEAKSLA